MTWLSGLLDRGRIHAVDGSVFCPYRGTDVSMEECYSCSRFLRTGADSTGPWIRCRPDGYQRPASGSAIRPGGQ